MNQEKKPLSILILDIKWPPETFIERKIEGLIKKGYHISVASGSSRSDSKYIVPGVSVIYLPRWDDPLINRLFIFLFAFVSLLVTQRNGVKKLFQLMSVSKTKSFRARFNFLLKSLVLLRENPTIVHFEWNSAAIEYQHLLKIWDCANVISCRGSQINIRPHLPDQYSYLEGLKFSFDKANAVHCVSGSIKKEAEKYGLSSKKARVIYPSVEPEVFLPNNQKVIDSKIFKIISVGNLVWMKGYEYALMAVKILVDQGVNLTYQIVGDGEDYQHILFTVHDLGLSQVVHLVGKISTNQVIQKLQHADVLLLPSLSEGISNAVLEAMSCGLPVVTTDCGGMTEAVTDGIEGFVVPVRDPYAMAGAILRLVQVPSVCLRMGKASRNRILQEFNLINQIDAFAELYQSIVQE